MFELIDERQNMSQKFIISPRYYMSDETDSEGDGLYEFQTNDTKTRSYSSLFKVERKAGKHSGRFILHYGNLSSPKHEGKLTVIVELSENNEMVSFDVNMMEIYVGKRKKDKEEKVDYPELRSWEHGKDVVINWDFVDFNSNNELWFDANGLQMVYK